MTPALFNLREELPAEICDQAGKAPNLVDPAMMPRTRGKTPGKPRSRTR